ncbi:MAG: hypothetical protein JXX29_03915 [Deltaproteobacteria bacterium]|nr:hypothetical protein [Deltaproteobacteria bacterium]MBN2670790.1 hypothetical protein [Deltaproteobacteria bacterium]
MANRNLTEQVKIGLAVGAIALTFLAAILDRMKANSKKNEAARAFLENTAIMKIGKYSLNVYQSFVAALLFAAVFGTVNYNRYDTDLIENGYDEYDLLHYYINAKYFDELGYFRLLPSLLVASNEAGPFCERHAPVYLAQDEEDYRIRPVGYALAQREEIKSHFTPERWAEFTHDAIFIQRESKRLSCNLWRQLLQDHGFNGTPTWVLAARPITNIVPVEHIKYATLVDLFLIIAMLGVVFWAFGAQTFAFAWIFITVCYSFRWPTITWVLLRYDWMTFMVMGVCLIKKEKHVAAGAFFAWAALMRYFPALWLFGIAAKGVQALLTNKNVPWSKFWLRVPMAYYKMAAGFFGLILFVLPISFAADGIDSHKQSLANMTAHVEPHNLSSMRQGLAIALTYRGETDMTLISAEKKLMVEEMEKPLRYVSIALLIVLGLFLSRAKDWEAVGLGIIPYFFLTTSSYYYYSMRLTAIVIHAADLSKKRNVVGLTILFAIELFCHASEYLNNGNRYFLISVMGLMMLGYAIAMYAFFGVKWWKERKPPEKKLDSDAGDPPQTVPEADAEAETAQLPDGESDDDSDGEIDETTRAEVKETESEAPEKVSRPQRSAKKSKKKKRRKS